MAKDTYYFPHDSNARNDIKLVKVRRKYKMAGYGAYFAIIEILREQDGYKLPLADIGDIAYELEVKDEVIKSIIEDFSLFLVEDNYFFSPSLLVRMCKYDALKSKRKEAGKLGGKASVKQRSSKGQAKLKQSSSIPQALEESKGEESKGEEKKVEDRKGKKRTETIFRDSIFFDIEKFKSEFSETKYAIYNLEFYYEKVLNWSDSKGAKKVDWIATARNFMLGDIEQGKAVLLNQNLLNQNGKSGTGGQGKEGRYDILKQKMAYEMGGDTGKSDNNPGGNT